MKGLISFIIIVLVLAAFFKVLPFVAIACGIMIVIAVIVKIANRPKKHKAPTNAKIADTINTKVVGVTFNGIQGILPKLHRGMTLNLVREPKNQYDRNAIAVICGINKIGHLSSDLAARIAPLMDSGTHVEGKISEITGGGSYSYGCNIEVYIFTNPQKFIPKQRKPFTTRIFSGELPELKTAESFAPSKVTYKQLPYLYQHSMAIYSLQELIEQTEKIRPEKYKKHAFTREPKCSREDIEAELRNEAENGINEGIYLNGDINQMISEYIDDILERRKIDHEKWERDKEIYDSKEAEFAEKCNNIYNQNAQIEKNIIMDKCKEDKAFITRTIEDRLSKLPFPYQYSANYEYSLLRRTLWLKIDLPNIEDIPQENTQKETKFKFVEDAFSISVYVANILFDISVYVECIHLSAFTVKRNKDGDAIKECVLSIKYTRDKFEGMDFMNLDLHTFCMQFENRCNITATGIMKSVKPYESKNANQP